jgi:uncharacterized protein involved in outer membrane biogenesis
MRRRVALLVVAGVVLAAAAGLYVWARTVLTGDAVRRAVEAQLARALGQPVAIGGLGATILPRVTMSLRDVAIGQPARITIARLDVGTNTRALLSRRVEHGTVRASGARIELPLPPLAIGAGAAAGADDAPLHIVSIDDIDISGAEIVSGGRVLRGDVRVVPAGRGLDVRRVSLTADGTSVQMSGAIADLAGPVGQLEATARGLNVLDLLGFVDDFSTGLAAGPDAPAAADAVPMDLQIAVEADRAMVGTLALDSVRGRARLTPEAVTLQPATFSVFGGRYSGALSFTLAETPGFHIVAELAGIDVAAVMAFAGAGDALTGRLAGTIDVRGRGTSASQATASARGRARLDLANGTVEGLNLVRTIVLAGSMRKDSRAQVSGVPAARAEPFDSLTASFVIGGGAARTDDLQFRSADVLLTGAGVIELARQGVDLVGRVQLSDELSKQAGRDLLRYTREDGRVTLPVVVSGTAGDLTVMIDVGDAAKRAIVNRAAEEAKKAISRALGRIIK